MMPTIVSTNGMMLGAIDFRIMSIRTTGPKNRTAKHAYTIGQVKKYIMKFKPPSFFSTAYSIFI